MTEKIACLFPGQGSQFIGMLSEYATHPTVKAVFNQASALLQQDLWAIAQSGPADIINRTDITQPLLLTASVALWQIWCEENNTLPHYLMGHSLGEYTALVCAQALPFEAALRAVALRGQFMQNAVNNGAMAAILGLDDAIVEDICQTVREQNNTQWVSAANYNAPLQVVISGNTEMVLNALTLAQQRGAKKCVHLPVSVPSHCILMQPAAEALEPVLRDLPWHTPKIPVLQNASNQIYATIPEIIDALIAQLCQPVRWAAGIQILQQQGVSIWTECGPGRVLTGLNKRILAS